MVFTFSVLDNLYRVVVMICKSYIILLGSPK